MRAFLTIWAGQLLSVTGSGLAQFALGVWVYQTTGSVTQFSLVLLAMVVPQVALAPLIGVLVDRWDRRRAMMLGDTGSAATILAVALLLFTGRLEVWHLFPLLAAGSVFQSVQQLAYSAVTTLLVPKEQFARASGMVQTSEALAMIVAPIGAGFLMAVMRVEGILLIDFVTFSWALILLLLVRVPRPEKSNLGRDTGDSIWRQAALGWTFIRKRRGLLGLLVLFAFANFSVGIVEALGTPMVLDFASPQVLGMIIGVASVGMLLGTIVLTAWGGPKRRMAGVIGFGMVLGLGLTLAGLRPSALPITAAFFIYSASLPFILGCSQAIWQSKTPPDVQGRVFAVRRMVARSTLPLGYLSAGFLADELFEPLLAVGGPLAGSAGVLIGVGPGRGIGLIFVLLGLLVMLAFLASFLYPAIWRVEQELPDAVGEAADAAEAGTAVGGTSDGDLPPVTQSGD